MEDGSFNGMSATRHTAQRIVSELLVERFKLTPHQSALLEDDIESIISSQSRAIYNMRQHEYDLEDADNFLRGLSNLEEEYDKDGNRILLNEEMLNLLIDETSDVYDAELCLWSNFENAHYSLLQSNDKYKEYVHSIDHNDESDEDED